MQPSYNPLNQPVNSRKLAVGTQMRGQQAALGGAKPAERALEFLHLAPRSGAENPSRG